MARHKPSRAPARREGHRRAATWPRTVFPRARRGAGDDGGDLHLTRVPRSTRAESIASVELGHVSNARAEAAPACPSFHSPSDRPSLPRPTHLQTTIMACQYKGGVVLGADSRTSTGTYVANRASDKITQVTDNVWMCRSARCVSVDVDRATRRRRIPARTRAERVARELGRGARARAHARRATATRAPRFFFRSSGARRRRFRRSNNPKARAEDLRSPSLPFKTRAAKTGGGHAERVRVREELGGGAQHAASRRRGPGDGGREARREPRCGWRTGTRTASARG